LFKILVDFRQIVGFEVLKRGGGYLRITESRLNPA